jgi:hypothetical protein
LHMDEWIDTSVPSSHLFTLIHVQAAHSGTRTCSMVAPLVLVPGRKGLSSPGRGLWLQTLAPYLTLCEREHIR